MAIMSSSSITDFIQVISIVAGLMLSAFFNSSITDWIQAIASILGVIVSIWGVYYVRNTLKAQLAVNQQQATLLQIESNRAAREVKPVLIITLATSLVDGIRPWVDYTMECSGNPAFGVRVMAQPDDTNFPGDEPTPIWPQPLDSSIDFLGSFAGFNMMPGDKVTFKMGYGLAKGRATNIHYKDMDGRELTDYYYLSHAKPARRLPTQR